MDGMRIVELTREHLVSDGNDSIAKKEEALYRIHRLIERREDQIYVVAVREAGDKVVAQRIRQWTSRLAETLDLELRNESGEIVPGVATLVAVPLLFYLEEQQQLPDRLEGMDLAAAFQENRLVEEDAIVYLSPHLYCYGELDALFPSRIRKMLKKLVKQESGRLLPPLSRTTAAAAAGSIRIDLRFAIGVIISKELVLPFQSLPGVEKEDEWGLAMRRFVSFRQQWEAIVGETAPVVVSEPAIFSESLMVGLEDHNTFTLDVVSRNLASRFGAERLLVQVAGQSKGAVSSIYFTFMDQEGSGPLDVVRWELHADHQMDHVIDSIVDILQSNGLTDIRMEMSPAAVH